MASIMFQIARRLRNRRVVANQVIETEGERLHFWGVQGGTTILIHQRGHGFVDWEELPDPIGIAMAPYRQSPQREAAA